MANDQTSVLEANSRQSRANSEQNRANSEQNRANSEQNRANSEQNWANSEQNRAVLRCFKQSYFILIVRHLPPEVVTTSLSSPCRLRETVTNPRDTQ